MSENVNNVLQNINNLQSLEKRMFDDLAETDSSNAEEQQALMEQINELSNTRLNLLQNLSNDYSTSSDELNYSRVALQNELGLLGVVESELNKAKHNYDVMKNNENNKLRMIEISNYEMERSYAHKNIMYTVLIGLLFIFAFVTLYRFDLIPGNVLTGSVVITLAILLVIVIRRLIDLNFRSYFVYDQYNWGTPSPDVNKNKNAGVHHTTSILSKPKTTAVVKPVESSNTEGFCNFH